MFKEHFNAMLSDDKAVSPVIGVILMVAVTVILAAVIGAFVLGFGDSLSEPAPDAQIDFDYSASADQLEISHDGGQTLNAQNTGFLSVNDGPFEEGASFDNTEAASVWVQEDPASIDNNDNYRTAVDSQYSSGTTIFDTDQSAQISVGSDVSGDSINLVWENSDASNSQEIGSYTFP